MTSNSVSCRIAFLILLILLIKDALYKIARTTPAVMYVGNCTDVLEANFAPSEEALRFVNAEERRAEIPAFTASASVILARLEGH